MNIAILTLVFGGLSLLASSFVVVPLLRSRTAIGGKHYLALGSGFAVLAGGLAAYFFLGQPQIAVATLGTPSNDDYPALVATLARRMPDRPGDLDGWRLLGRGYIALGNPVEGSKALSRAVAIAREEGVPNMGALLIEYGEALIDANRQVDETAEAAFKEALVYEPGSLVPRYYLGLARAQRSDKAGALEILEKLAADAPPNWEGLQSVNFLIGSLKGEGGAAAPNPVAMVAQLAARLESNPDDINGWVMLIRAYSVLGEREKAMGALAKARSVFSGEAEARAALDAAAKENSLN